MRELHIGAAFGFVLGGVLTATAVVFATASDITNWLYRWQTLVAAFLAVPTALLTIWATWHSVQMTLTEQRRRADEQRSTEATLVAGLLVAPLRDLFEMAAYTTFMLSDQTVVLRPEGLKPAIPFVVSELITDNLARCSVLDGYIALGIAKAVDGARRFNHCVATMEKNEDGLRWWADGGRNLALHYARGVLSARADVLPALERIVAAMTKPRDSAQPPT